jgi:hypothetical protein
VHAHPTILAGQCLFDPGSCPMQNMDDIHRISI